MPESRHYWKASLYKILSLESSHTHTQTEAVSLLVDAEPGIVNETKAIIDAARNGQHHALLHHSHYIYHSSHLVLSYFTFNALIYIIYIREEPPLTSDNSNALLY